MAKLPTRSPTHEDVDPARLAGLGLELEELADGADTVTLRALVEHAEDRGRPASHYLVALPLATDLQLARTDRRVLARVCAGTCQRYGALDLLDHLAGHAKRPDLAPVSCLDRCDQGPAIELQSPDGNVVLAPATIAGVDEALASLAE